MAGWVWIAKLTANGANLRRIGDGVAIESSGFSGDEDVSGEGFESEIRRQRNNQHCVDSCRKQPVVLEYHGWPALGWCGPAGFTEVDPDHVSPGDHHSPANMVARAAARNSNASSPG